MSAVLGSIVALMACSSSEPNADGGAASDAAIPGDAATVSCVPVHEPAGGLACTKRGCSGFSTGVDAAEVAVCTRKCAAATGCGTGEVCARPVPEEPELYCFLRCDDARCKAPLKCDKATNTCRP